MPESDLDLLTDAAQKAGAIATSFFRASPKVWEKPGLGPVTEADIAVDDMLRETLLSARPDFGWLSEETVDNADRLTTDCQFIIDPIDGTRAFIEGSKDWALSLAVVQGGTTKAAVVYLPAKDLLFAAGIGTGAMLNSTPIGVAKPTEPATLLTPRVSLDVTNWKDAQPPNVKRHFRSSLAYRMCLVAQGRFDGMMTLRPSWEWDIAAGQLIIQEAGGVVTDKTGAALCFNNKHPKLNGVIGASSALHTDILDRLL